MALKKYKPTSPRSPLPVGLRLREITKFDAGEVPGRSRHRTGGRNNNGRITTRHQGGGHKRATA
jgi:large subunit ribosomal protein L2